MQWTCAASRRDTDFDQIDVDRTKIGASSEWAGSHEEFQMYKRILVPVDGSSTSNAGLAEAVKVARLTGARIRVLHVVDEMPFLMSSNGYDSLTGNVFSILKNAGETVLEAARAQVEEEGIAVEAALFDSLSGRLCDRVLEQSEARGTLTCSCSARMGDAALAGCCWAAMPNRLFVRRSSRFF